jgi:hypothetical protein
MVGKAAVDDQLLDDPPEESKPPPPPGGGGYSVDPDAARGLGGSIGERGLEEASRAMTESRDAMKETRARQRATMDPLYADAESTLRNQQANAPAPPQMQRMPAAPKQTSGELIQGAQGYIGALMVLQALGSMGRRGPGGRNDGTTAMMAIAGIFQGAQQGAKEVVEENTKLWEASTKGVIETNRQKLQEYKTILESNQYEFNQKMQLIQLKAKEFDDEFAYQRAQAQDAVALGKYMVSLEKANDRLAYQEERIELLREKQKMLAEKKTGAGAADKPSTFSQAQGIEEGAMRMLSPQEQKDPGLVRAVQEYLFRRAHPGGEVIKDTLQSVKENYYRQRQQRGNELIDKQTKDKNIFGFGGNKPGATQDNPVIVDDEEDALGLPTKTFFRFRDEQDVRQRP